MVDLTTKATVRLWGRTVGYLVWSQARQHALFEYEPDFVRSGIEIAPLAMPLVEGEVYAFGALPRETFKGLPSCFADSLPGNFGNAVLDAWLARVGSSPRDLNPVDRLLHVGTRGMGALEYLPATESHCDGDGPISIGAFAELAGKLACDVSGGNTQIGSQAAPELFDQFQRCCTSVSGAKAKAAVLLDDATGEIHVDQYPAPAGHSSWMLSLDTTTFGLNDYAGYCRIEYAYYLMAIAAGVHMMPSRLLVEGGRAYFMTRRFDRTAQGGKVHIQSLFSMDQADYKLPGSYSYEEVFAVMRELAISRRDQEQFYRRMIFNVLARNHDDHPKSVSFMLSPDGDWHLTPAYDVGGSHLASREGGATHQMTINGKRDHWGREELVTLARQQLPRFDAERVIDDVAIAVSDWVRYAKEAGVPENAAHQIEQSHSVEGSQQ